MIVKYSKKRLNTSLYLGLVWLIIGLLSFIYKENLFWTDYGYLVIGTIYLGKYFYDKKNAYFVLGNDEIVINNFLKKTIKISDIKQIKKFAGDYIIKLKNDKEYTIYAQVIQKEAIQNFNLEIEKLALQVE